MGKILVAGLANIETTVKIESFPLLYYPVTYPFFGVNTEVSGVGYNIAKALSTLGDNIDFLSIIGNDFLGKNIRDRLKFDLIYDKYVINGIKQTSNTVVIYDSEGNRQIHCDLKDLQDTIYPIEYFETAIRECTIAIICNINFCRPFLEIAKKYKKPICTDIHNISDINDSYNRDFISNANVLFMSNDNLLCEPEYFVKKILDQFGTEIIVVGMGKKGALLSVKSDNFLERIPAVKVRDIVNTVGAGDSLFSCFTHFYNRTKDPYDAIKRAVVFAGYKIGESGASSGFIDERELNNICSSIYK